MADIIRLQSSPHERAQGLLSWYANGTLTPDEQRLVDDHLADCAQCRSDLAFDRQLQAQIAALPIEQEQGWSAMEQRLAAREARPAGRLWQRRVPIGWAVAGPVAALAASLLLFVSLGGPAGETLTRPAGEYQALSGTAPPATGNMLVIFAPQTREGDLRALLLANQVKLVDGPNASGAYLLAVAADRRERTLARLREVPQVMLAEPVDADFRQ